MDSIAVLGAGALGSALIAGLLKAGVMDALHLAATVGSPEHAAAVSARFGIRCLAGSNLEATQAADVIVLSVKPAVAPQVLDEIHACLRAEQILISLVASLPIRIIEERIGIRMPVFRAVTNTPLAVGAGATALAANEAAAAPHRAIVESMFGAVGAIAFVEEDQMDAANALAGCGPAYIYMVIEAMIAGGVKLGLSRAAATLLAEQTVLGAAILARESGLDPATLCAQVIKPGGATMTGIQELEKQGLHSMMRSAIEAAARHSEVRTRTLLDI